MMSDPDRRLAAALEQMEGLGSREQKRFLAELDKTDPEVASRVRGLLNIPPAGTESETALDAELLPSDEVPLADPNRGLAVASVDTRVTASFPPTAVSVPRDPNSTGAVLGRYQLVRAVGRGAFGDVWKAFDPILNKHVAVKIARSDKSISAAKVIEEARKAASLQRHPAIVQVLDAVPDESGWYIISEFIDGENLRTRLDAGRVPLEEAVRIVKTVAGALHAAHLTGLVHRDVKPGNILLDRSGNAYLTDFGLAVREEDQFRERSKVSGTLAYMSPEQISGDTHLLDGRADIYALGTVFYELLTGRPLFRATDLEGYREQILRREPRPPRSIDPAVPEELEHICLKCLAKEVKDRYRTAQDVAIALDGWLMGSTQSQVIPQPAPVRRGRWKWVATGVAVVLVAALVGLVIYDNYYRPATVIHNQPTPVQKVPAAKELIWDRANPVNEWKVLPDGRRLKVDTRGISLLQVGQTTAAAWEFSATMSHFDDTKGHFGLFLGYRDPKNGEVTYEAVKFVRFPNAYHLMRSVETYVPDKGVPPNVEIYGYEEQSELPRQNTIRLVVRDNVLTEVWLNSERIDKLLQLPGAPPPRFAHGSFGVYNQDSNGIFFDLQFDGSPIPLLVEPPPNAERP